LARLLASSGRVTEWPPGAAPPGAVRHGAVRHGAVRHGAVRPGAVRPDGGGTRPGADGAARRAARRWALLVAVGWLAQAGLRAWFSRAQSVPLANPDESAYLIAARVLAGGAPADFSGSTLYQGGYPLLITPVFWLTHNPVAAYRAVLMINAAVSALIMPLGYAACRRLGLGRPAAYGVAMAAALLPAALFYSEYAMADAIFPVITLAWLLAAHGWLTAASLRGRYAAAAGSAAAAGYAYAVHPRGLVIVGCYVVFGVLVLVRRLVPRGTVAAAAAALAAVAGAGWELDRRLAAVMYSGGTRSLSGEVTTRLHSAAGVVHVLEMAAGQLWRLSLDSWGIAGIGLAAAVAVAARGWPSRLAARVGWPGRLSPRAYPGGPGSGADLRVMAALAVAVTVIIAGTAPAALPDDTAQAWASARYLDGMIVVFFLAGGVVLLRAGRQRIAWYAACTAGCTVVAAVTVAAYAGTSLPLAGFGAVFNFAEPAVLTQDWTQPGVALTTAAALGLLAVWVALALAGRSTLMRLLPGRPGQAGTRLLPGRPGRAGERVLPGRRRAGALLAAGGIAAAAAVGVIADAQVTSHVSQAATPAQAEATSGFVAASGLRPGERIAISTGVNWEISVPQEFEVWWTQPESFDPASQPPPAGVTVVEVPWPAGRPARASWPKAPAGWRIVAASAAGGWVAWRAPATRK